jgi:hypothetical protein
MPVRYTHAHHNCLDCNRKVPGFLFEEPGVCVSSSFVCHPCAARSVDASVLNAAVEAHKERALGWMAQVQTRLN